MSNSIISFFSGVCTGYIIVCVINHEYKKNYLKKLDNFEKRIEKLEDFRFSLYEKNLLLGEKREWDEISSDLSDHSDRPSEVEEEEM